MSKEERYYFDSYDYIVDRQKIINGEEDVTVCDFCDWGKIVDILNEQDQRIADLEAKLAESEEENTKLKEVVDCVDKLKQFNADMNDYALVNRDVADEIYCEHQNKISFAVEQLEFAQKYIQQYVNNVDDMNDCLYAIDNQIKQLKEMK